MAPSKKLAWDSPGLPGAFAMAGGDMHKPLLVEDETLIAMVERMPLEGYGYVVKNSGITDLDASIKMAWGRRSSLRQFRREKPR